MKIFNAMVLVGLTFFGCTKKEYTLGIDVQSAFNQDQVQIFLDGGEVLNKNLETNYTIGVCLGGSVVIDLAEGKHVMLVRINGNEHSKEVFSIHNDHYIGVNYNPQTKEISYLHSDHIFRYD